MFCRLTVATALAVVKQLLRTAAAHTLCLEWSVTVCVHVFMQVSARAWY